MSEIIFEVREDEADGGYNAAALGHDIFTEGDTLPVSFLPFSLACRPPLPLLPPVKRSVSCFSVSVLSFCCGLLRFLCHLRLLWPILFSY
jgi:hypothetical protein